MATIVFVGMAAATSVRKSVSQSVTLDDYILFNLANSNYSLQSIGLKP